MPRAVEMSGAESAIQAIEVQHGDRFRSLPAHVAVVDATGAIRLVNPAWEAFARDNGGQSKAYLGQNYLDVCRKWAESEGDGEAALFGVNAVLSGDQPEFQLDYPCHSPTEQRWFRMEVVPLDRQCSSFIVSHIDITQATRQHLALHEIAASVRSSLSAIGFNVARADPSEGAKAAPQSEDMPALLGEAVAEAHYLAARLYTFVRRGDFSAREQTEFAAAMINQWATAIGTDMFEGKTFFGKGE
jgi:hypothetical protein